MYNYVLLRNETDVGLSGKGTWTEKISRGETFVYRCCAYQKVDNVSSTDNVTVTVNGKIKYVLNKLSPSQNIVWLTEVELYVSVFLYKFEIQISPLLIFFFVSSLSLMKSADMYDFYVCFFFFRLHFGFTSTSFLVILICGHESKTKAIITSAHQDEKMSGSK